MRNEARGSRHPAAALPRAPPRPAGGGRRLRLVEGSGLRELRGAGERGAGGLRAPRLGADARNPPLLPHRRGAAAAGLRRGCEGGRAAQNPTGLEPVEAAPHGAAGHRCRRLPPRLGHIDPGPSPPLPLVSRHADGRRRRAPRRACDRRRPAGSGHRPHGLLQAALAAQGGDPARRLAPAHARRGRGSGTPAGCWWERRPSPTSRWRGDAASAGAGASVWRTPSGAALLDLRTVLDHTGPRGAWPDEEPPVRAVPPRRPRRRGRGGLDASNDC